MTLRCRHHPELARATRDAARRARFPQALDLGLELVSMHEHGNVCGCRFAADLLPIANAAEHPMLAGLLIDVAVSITGAGTLTGKARTTKTSGFVAVARTNHVALSADDADLRDRRMRLAHHRIARSEVMIRLEREPGFAPARGLKRRPRTALVRSRTFQSVVGCGLALLHHEMGNDGRILLWQAVRSIERADRSVRALLNPDPPDLVGLASAMNRWAWASSVVAAADDSDADDWKLHRLVCAARFFGSVGHPVGAADAYSKIARIEHAAGTSERASNAARQSLSFIEERFAMIADSASTRRWREIAGRASTVGLKTAENEEVRFFFTYDSACDWLGLHHDVDDRVGPSSTSFRSLGNDPERELRIDFENMLRDAVRVLQPADAGGPMTHELVEMERADLVHGGSPLWLARALAMLAVHHTRSGDIPDAVATAREAVRLFRSLRELDTHDEVDRMLRSCLYALDDDWSGAVRFAVAFHDFTTGTSQDLVRTLHVRATTHGRLDVIEELAAFVVGAARARSTTDGLPMVRLLCSWGVARDALSAGAGAPAFSEALDLAEQLVADDPIRNVPELIHARIQVAHHSTRAARHSEGREVLDRTWHEISGLGVPEVEDPDALIELVEAAVAVQRTARGRLRILVPAADHLFSLVHDQRENHPGSLRKLASWASDLHELGATGVAVDLFTALVRLPGVRPAQLRVQLATALRTLDDLTAAQYWIEDALRLAPVDVDVHQAAGQLHLDFGDPVAAHTAFTRAIDLGGGTWSHVLRGTALLRAGRAEDCVEDLSLAVRRFPHGLSAAWLLARAHRQMNAPDQALAVLTRVGPGAENDDWWRYQIGLSLAQVGDRGEATEYFADACELGFLPGESFGPNRRRGDPNLGLYLLAAGHENEAAREFDRLRTIGLPRASARELKEDLVELAGALPDRAESAARFVDVLLCR